MKRKLIIAASLIVLSVNAVLFYLSEQAEIRRVTDNAETLDVFRSLQLLDRAVDTELLMLQAGQAKNYDKITNLQAQHRQGLLALQQISATELNQHYPKVEALIEEYTSHQQKVLPLIDQYKSQLALLKNSLSYVNVLATEIHSQFAQANDPLRGEFDLLIPELMHYLANDNPQSREILIGHLEAIRARLNNHPQQDSFEKLYRHITTVMTGREISTNNLNAILSSSHADMPDAILKQYQAQHRTQVQKHQLHAYVAIAILLLLAAAIIYSIYRLILGAAKLDVEKDNLSHEVQESRESLQQSNEELKREICQRKQAEEELKNAAALYEHCNEGVVICNQHQIAISINPAYTNITGITADNIIGKTPRIFDTTAIPPHTYTEMIETLTSEGEWQGEVETRNANGQITPKEVSLISLKKEGQIYRYIVILTDISERRKQQETIHFQANYDPLTNLPNRNLFNERARQTLAKSERSCNKFALLFIDLDSFKKVNDNLGHHIGDELLSTLASRLNSIAREVDTVSRFGGDEFIMLLDNVQRKNDLQVVLDKLITSINTPIETSAETIHSSASIGISIYPDDGSDMDTLIRCADMAMYKAKQQGKNNYCFFEEKMDQEIHAYHRMENQLRKAIANNELSLVYQPIVDARDQAIYATEALVRWEQDGNIIPPNKFIPIAEESGLIVSIGEWILRSACQQLRRWNDEFNRQLKMSINVSTLQFRHPAFADTIDKIISETGVNPHNLNFEITESLFLEDSDSRVFKTMNNLRSRGVSISLDDFGTGYSSLSYLKHFPVTVLKIDRTFVRDVIDDASDQSLIKAIINLAEGLNIAVVAEGVETQEQYELLSAYRCNYIQGYYFSQPISAEDLQDSFLEGNRFSSSIASG